jgi:diacylglycerol kinase family enzyme
MGAIRYRWAAFRAIMQTRRFSAIIRCGAIVHRVRTVQVTIGNGRLFAGGMDTTTVQQTDAGALSVYSLEPTRRWGLLFMANTFTAAPGETIAEARYTQSPVVEVVTRLPQPICADGEIVTVTPARFSLLPQLVSIYVPAASQSKPELEPANPPIGSVGQIQED